MRFATQKAWERWLRTNHAKEKEVWIEIAKKAATFTTVTYPEAMESALCYGWIDSMMRSGGPEFTIQRFSPRGPRSKWSQTNQQIALRLIEEGRMQPAGLKAVEDARAAGRFELQ